MSNNPENLPVSFEFFPPRSPEAVVRLEATRDRLQKFSPEFYSVTFGAGGSTRDLTFETVQSIREATGVDAAPHISCMGFKLDEIRAILQQYRAAGIKRLVALRGDMPSGTTGFGELRFANELVAFIREETADAFYIEVAAYPEFHPQAQSARQDLDNFKRKVEAGADRAITQYFYNPDAYFRFVDSCQGLGIDVPIVAGIMPITNFTQLMRFSDMCGAEIPRWIVQRLRDFGDDSNSIRQFGIEVTTALCATLIEGGVPGIHFYTMNQWAAPEAICENLSLGPSDP
ncbi:MAG: methylenetetrahydrofolate reductase [NAD(P)H] [Pseudomonadota bacterium]